MTPVEATLETGDAGISHDLRIAFAKKAISLENASIVPGDPVENRQSWKIELADGEAYTLVDRGDRLRLTRDEGRAIVAGLWDGPRDVLFVGSFVLLLLFNGLFLDVNISSLHGFYRDRLTRAYLGRADRERGTFESLRSVNLSEICPPGSGAPYHLVNTALNLQASTAREIRSKPNVHSVVDKLSSINEYRRAAKDAAGD